MQETIETLEKIISDIRSEINSGIDQRIAEGDALSEHDKLTEDSPLEDYIEKIKSLKSSIESTNQQLLIFYVAAENEEDAFQKQMPIVTWTYNEDECKYNDIEYDFTYAEWLPSVPVKNVNEKLFMRFASIHKGGDLQLGDPIQMTGDKGESGEQGPAGRDAIIVTQLHRIVKLYYINDVAPNINDYDFYMDHSISEQKSNHQLSENRIYYQINDSKIYVDEENSDWKLMVDSSNLISTVWEIEVQISSKENTVTILKNPSPTTLTVKEIKTLYTVSDSDKAVPMEWNDNRELTPEQPYLWTNTITTYSNDTSFSQTRVVQQLPTMITNIDVKYAASQSVTELPEENSDMWTDIYPIGPVIWKKEVVTYTTDVAGLENKSKTTICPIALQGPAGIQFIAKLDTVDDLSNIDPKYGTDYIGKLGVKVDSGVYIWYGNSDPNLGSDVIQKGNNFWLNIGPIGNDAPDWNASENEDGFIHNRTHYKKSIKHTEHLEGNLDSDTFTIKLPNGAKNVIVTFDDASNYTTPVLNNGDEYECEHGVVTFNNGLISYNSYTSGYVTYDLYEYKTLDWNYLPSFIENTTYEELCTLKDNSQLIPGKKYCVSDYSENVVIIVSAISESELSPVAVAKSNEKTYNVWYTLENKNRYWINQYTTIAFSQSRQHYVQHGNLEKQIENIIAQYALNAQIMYVLDDSDDIKASIKIGDKTKTYQGAVELGELAEFLQNNCCSSEYRGIGTDNANATIIAKLIPSEGKGTILRMSDEFGNDIPYDYSNNSVFYNNKISSYFNNGKEYIPYGPIGENNLIYPKWWE